MSVINRVLRDLEQRKASQVPAAQPVSGAAVRAVTPAHAGARTRIALGAAAVAATAAVAGALAPALWPGATAMPVSNVVEQVAGPESPSVKAPEAPALSPAPASPPMQVAAVSKPTGDDLPRPDAIWGAPVAAPAADVRPIPKPEPAPRQSPVAVAVPAPVRASAAVGRELPSRTSDATPGASAAGDARIERRERPLSALERAEVAFRAGVSALEHNQTAVAVARFDEALGLAADHIPARQAMLGILLEARRTMDAEALLLEGLDHVRHAPFALVASRLQLERGDVQAALATLEAFEDVGRSNPDYLATLAGVLQRAGRHVEAADRYQTAIAAGNPRAAWYLGRAISLRELGRGGEARSSFQQAIDTGSLAPEVQVYVEKQLAALRTVGS